MTLNAVVEISETDCEWETFTDGKRCNEHATIALLDPGEQSDPQYPEGLHVAHLCSIHAGPGLLAINGYDRDGKAR